MKNDLIITRFLTENVPGTFSVIEPRSFFGSKILKTEDNILIDNSYIQYSEVIDVSNPNGLGYQYNNDILKLEKPKLVYYTDIKKSNHRVNMAKQSKESLSSNTEWLITINWKKILTEYLFANIKSNRLFKCIKNENLIQQNINNYIYEYINKNIVYKYRVKDIIFYIKYEKLIQDNFLNDVNLKYGIKFDDSIMSDENRIQNITSKITDNNIALNYKQTQVSTEYNFKYYFNLTMEKI